MNALDVEFLEQFRDYSGGQLASRSTEIEFARIEGDDLILHVRRDDSLYRIVVLDHRNWGNVESVTLSDDPAEMASYIISYLDEVIDVASDLPASGREARRETDATRAARILGRRLAQARSDRAESTVGLSHSYAEDLVAEVRHGREDRLVMVEVDTDSPLDPAAPPQAPRPA